MSRMQEDVIYTRLCMTIESLLDECPAASSPKAVLLHMLSEALERYERASYPEVFVTGEGNAP